MVYNSIILMHEFIRKAKWEKSTRLRTLGVLKLSRTAKLNLLTLK